MFEFTKFAGWLLSPLTLALLGLLLALLGRKSRLGAALGGLSLALLALASTPWFAQTLASSLERQHPALSVQQTAQADAALVLGGVLAPAQPPERPHANLGAAIDRLWHAASLYRAGKVQWIVLAGGNQPGYEHMQPEAQAMRELLLAWGVPASAIVLEGRSRNTAENARHSAALLAQIKARRVLLVSSALHMPRALALFQAELAGSGVELLPASTDVEAPGGDVPLPWRWLPDSGALNQSSRALKEYLGQAYVRLQGLL